MFQEIYSVVCSVMFGLAFPCFVSQITYKCLVKGALPPHCTLRLPLLSDILMDATPAHGGGTDL